MLSWLVLATTCPQKSRSSGQQSPPRLASTALSGMSFGLSNAPWLFQHMICVTFGHLGPESGVLMYMDETICLSSTFEDELKSLEQMFSALQTAGLTLKLSKRDRAIVSKPPPRMKKSFVPQVRASSYANCKFSTFLFRIFENLQFAYELARPSHMFSCSTAVPGCVSECNRCAQRPRRELYH